jgi:peptide-methionine (S)-S-oxide reductase
VPKAFFLKKNLNYFAKIMKKNSTLKNLAFYTILFTPFFALSEPEKTWLNPDLVDGSAVIENSISEDKIIEPLINDLMIEVQKNDAKKAAASQENSQTSEPQTLSDTTSEKEFDLELIDKNIEKNISNNISNKKKQKTNTNNGQIVSESEVSGGNNFDNIVFAGGSYWFLEEIFNKIDGVVSTTAGYTGGETKNPSYEDVAKGDSGHFEAVQVVFNANKISLEKLLGIYLHNIDPLSEDGQFCDKGKQYNSAIFYNNDTQKNIISTSLDNAKNELVKNKLAQGPLPAAQLNAEAQNIFVQNLQLKSFYPAEEYQQDYYKRNALLYNIYKQRCARESKLRKLWGK